MSNDESEFAPAWARTVDHDFIRAWIEEHDGMPVLGNDAFGRRAIDVAFGEEAIHTEQISWEEFFEWFDDNGLIFHYRTEVAPGEEKLCYNFVTKENPSETQEDETELPEVNDLAQENMRTDYSEPEGEEEGDVEDDEYDADPADEL